MWIEITHTSFISLRSATLDALRFRRKTKIFWFLRPPSLSNASFLYSSNLFFFRNYLFSRTSTSMHGIISWCGCFTISLLLMNGFLACSCQKGYRDNCRCAFFTRKWSVLSQISTQSVLVVMNNRLFTTIYEKNMQKIEGYSKDIFISRRDFYFSLKTITNTFLKYSFCSENMRINS